MKRTSFVRIIAVAVSVIILVCSGIVCVAAPSSDKPLRVGYLNGNGLTVNDAGQPIGYIYDYLLEISKYTGWEYEYISCGWDEGLRMLEAGELDLFGPLQKTAEREALYDYTETQAGIEYGALYVSEDRLDIYYNDFQSLDGMRVATTKQNFFTHKLDEFCIQNNINISYVYTDPSNYAQGLASGEFDAIISGSLLDIPNAVVVARISAEPTYFVTTKGNASVLYSLNNAIREIFRENAYFEPALTQKHYGEKSSSRPAYTREEASYLAQRPTLRVACSADWTPIQYYDDTSGQMKGISVDILNQISEISGLQFVFIETTSYTESIRMFESGEADLLIDGAQPTAEHTFELTNSFLQVPLVIAGRGRLIQSDQPIRVATHSSASHLAEKIEKNIGVLEVATYASSAEVIKALGNGKEKYALINYYAFDELVWNYPSDNYTFLSTDVSFPLQIGASNNLPETVLPILNKSIACLSPEQISSAVFINTAARPRKIPFRRIVNENSGYILLLIFAFGAILLWAYLENNRQSKKTLQTIAYTDSLTGLSTQLKFQRDAQKLLRHARPGQYSLLHMDIDHFKYINEMFGYKTGDQVLSAISDHLKEYSAWYTFVGRISADNFVFLVPTLSIEEILKQFSEMSDVMHHLTGVLPDQYPLVFATGMYVIDDPEYDFVLMLDKASAARKEVKGNYAARIMEYTPEMDQARHWKREVTLYMAQALQQGEFLPFLQPKVSLRDKRVIGAEALVRWLHPAYGLLAPAKFIELFERNGFIQQLDFYMIESICQLLAGWRHQQLPCVPISVNLSRVHLRNPNLADELLAITKKYDVPPSFIEIELTESIVFNDAEQLTHMMHKIRQAGFPISIDDFGSGYSSLNLLTKMPANVLKIDKGLIDQLDSAPDAGRIVVQKVVQMAKSLSMEALAEGVEQESQARILLEFGCDSAQGYYYAKPMPVADFEQYLQKHL